MERQEFLKTLGFGLLGFTVSGISILSCVTQDSDELEDALQPDKIRLTKELITKHFKAGDYAAFPEIYNQHRCILVVDDYEMLNSNSGFKKQGIDVVVSMKVFGMLNCNFDIYKEKFALAAAVKAKNDRIKSDRISDKYFLKTHNPDHSIMWFDWSENPKTLNFPVKVSTKHGKITVDEKYKFPCIMSRSSFDRMMSSGSKVKFNNIIKTAS